MKLLKGVRGLHNRNFATASSYTQTQRHKNMDIDPNTPKHTHIHTHTHKGLEFVVKNIVVVENRLRQSEYRFQMKQSFN